jgi:hypothetical protein
VSIYSPWQNGCVFTKVKVTYVILATILITQYQLVYFSKYHSFHPSQSSSPPFPNFTNMCFIGISNLYMYNLADGLSFAKVVIMNDTKGSKIYNFSTSIYPTGRLFCLYRCLKT